MTLILKIILYCVAAIKKNHLRLFRKLMAIYIYIYIYMCVCVCVCV